MNTRKMKFTATLSATLFSAAAFIWFAPVIASAQILKPSEIIYSRAATVDGGNCDTASIWVVGQDGSNDRFITNGLHPRISPDGRFLLFKRFQPSSLCSPFNVAPIWWIRELATKRETQIAFNLQPSSGHFFSPETNRGGHQIVKSDGAGICRMNKDGTNRVCSFIPSLDPIRGAGHPSVRGADNLLLVQNFQDNADGGLYTLNYDDFQNRQKIPNTIGRDLNPSWSNDGQRIAFAAFPTTRSEPYFFTNIFKINADGSNRTQLTFINQPSGEGFSYSMVWTLDNTTILNAAKINGVAGIYKISANGSLLGTIPITPGANPEWVGGIVPPYSEQQTASFGGGTTRGGNFTLVDTIGQAFAGQTSTSGGFNLQSGFWTNPVSVKSKFDFDGDGKADVSVFRPNNGAWYLQQSANGFFALAFGVSSDKLVPEDYDGDGKTDIAVYRNGTWYLQRSRLGFSAVNFGTASDIPAPADFNGDGKAEIAVFRPSNGTWYLLNLENNQVTATAFGQSGDVPVAADYDGDGKTDLAVFRPSAGSWYQLRSSQGFVGIQFGVATDKPAPGDYDGDGKADVAVFRPSNGTWYLQQSTNGFVGIQFGISSDLPAPADYDGDGKTDVAVFREGNWYQLRSTQGFTAVFFGQSGDKPVPNAFIP